MTKRVWKKGPPPHVGWWNASIAGDPDCWRWWDGNAWSAHVYYFEDDFSAAVMAGAEPPLSLQYLIQWTTYYPKNARVPRIDPREAKQCDTK